MRMLPRAGLLLAVGLTVLSQAGCGLAPRTSGWFDEQAADQWLQETAAELGANQVVSLRATDQFISAGLVVGDQVVQASTTNRPSEYQVEPLAVAGHPIELAQIDLGRLIETTLSFFGDCASDDRYFQVWQSGYQMHHVTSGCGTEQAPYYLLDGTYFADLDVDHQAGLADALDRIRRGAPDQAYWVQFAKASDGVWLEASYADPDQPPVKLLFQSTGHNSSTHTDEQGTTFSLAQLDATSIIACLDALGERERGSGVWTLAIAPGAGGRLEYTWNLRGGWTAPKSYLVTDANCRELASQG